MKTVRAINLNTSPNMASEFDLIKEYFTRPTEHTDLGIGDDAALVTVSNGHQLVVSADMYVAGTHFFHDCAPYCIGWKALAVNISDIAAMGATPKWATLSIALPETNPAWLAEFSRGFFACADTYHVDLIGGDTTRGPLNISVHIMGEAPHGQSLKRNGAQVGDEIWVSGTLGDAALALAALQGNIKLNSQTLASARMRLEQPEPRVALGLAIRNIAHSALDISDGLLADLGHILKASGVGAEIKLAQVPRSKELDTVNEPTLQQSLMLAGGDDYELCFTAPVSAHAEILAIGESLKLKLTAIGTITAATDLQVLDANNHPIILTKAGYDHFA